MSTYLLSFQLDCGAKVTARGVDHMTPLSVAAQKGSAEIMALFFKRCIPCDVFYSLNVNALTKITVKPSNSYHNSLLDNVSLSLLYSSSGPFFNIYT